MKRATCGWLFFNGQLTIMVFFFEKRFKKLKYIAEGNTIILNFQFSIVNSLGLWYDREKE